MEVHGYLIQKRSYQGSLRFFKVWDWGWTIIVGRPSKQFRRGWFIRATVVLVENAKNKWKISNSKTWHRVSKRFLLILRAGFLASLAASRTSANARTKKQSPKRLKTHTQSTKNNILPIFPEEKHEKIQNPFDLQNKQHSSHFSGRKARKARWWEECLFFLPFFLSFRTFLDALSPCLIWDKICVNFSSTMSWSTFCGWLCNKKSFSRKKLGKEFSSDPNEDHGGRMITGEKNDHGGRMITGEEWWWHKSPQSINQSINVHHPNEVPLCFWWGSSESPSCPTRRPDPTGTPYGPDGTADSSGAVPGWREDCRRSSPCASWTPSRPSPVQRAVLVRTSYRGKMAKCSSIPIIYEQKELWALTFEIHISTWTSGKVPFVGPYLAKRSFPVLSFFFVLLSSSWTCSSPSSFVDSSVRT